MLPRADSSPALLAALEHIIRADTRLMQLLRATHSADLPQCRVVAGCIYQTVWNSLTARLPGTGINDYDVIYFDDTDLSVLFGDSTAYIKTQLRLLTGTVVAACGVRARVEVARASKIPINKGILINDTLATIEPHAVTGVHCCGMGSAGLS